MVTGHQLVANDQPEAGFPPDLDRRSNGSWAPASGPSTISRVISAIRREG
jgi:hypothetical protein